MIIINSSNQVDQATAAPPMRQFPISYIRAFAYHPVAFPQPLAPITTYQVSRNSQSYSPNRNFQPSVSGIGNALSQVFQQKFLQNQEGSQNGYPMANSIVSHPPTQQQLPQNGQVDFGTPPTSTTTTSTTTVAPSTTQPPSFLGSQPTPQVYTRSGFHDGYQRQLPIQQNYQSGNFGGFPQLYNQPSYNQQFNPYQFNEQASQNQFSGRVFGGEPSYQQYQAEPMTYQFIPTSITPIPNNQNNVKFVPCMCPVAVSISSPPAEKRTNDEIPMLNPTNEPESLPQSVQSPTQQFSEERK